jgi:hypothetical protein
MKGNWLTVTAGAFLAVAPQMLSVVPSPYRDLASAVIAGMVAAWHLYQPVPK